MTKKNIRQELKALLDDLLTLESIEDRQKVCRQIWDKFKLMKTPEVKEVVPIKHAPMASTEKDDLTRELNRLKNINQGLEFKVNQVTNLEREIAKLRQD